jgi:hypothetical protein
MRRLFLTFILLIPFTANADSRLPFKKELAGDTELPLPWGLGIDFYTMEQDYRIDSLQFDIPNLTLDDPTLLGVENDIQHFDIKLDVWLLPFLNVFGIIGHIDADTIVDLSRVPAEELPFPLGKLDVAYDGTVYGAGFTLAYGNENWFTTLTSTFTNTDLSGNFDSDVSSTTIQPRVGLIRNDWQFWVGGLYLDTEETHSGSIGLPVFGEVPFNIKLSGADEWNYAVGARHVFSPKADLSFEIGFGERTHTLFNFTYRY